MSDAVQHAKATLLRALDQIEQAEHSLDGKVERVDLCVIYSMGHRMEDHGAWHEVGGWASTSAPKWVHAAMLHRAVRAFEGEPAAIDNEPDEDDA